MSVLRDSQRHCACDCCLRLYI